MLVSAPSDSFVSYESGMRLPRRSMAVAALFALSAFATGCADKPKESTETIAWSEPGTPSTVTGSVSPGTPLPAGTGQPMPSGPPLNWRTGLSGDTVTVEINDRNDFYRVERVELVGPNALTVAAYEINRQTNRATGDYYDGYGGGPSVGVGVSRWSGSGWNSGRSSGSGVGLGLGFPLGGSSSRSAPPPSGTITSARMRIPDLAYYRQTAASWVVRVHFTDRANQPTSAVIPAPKPAA